MGFVRKHIDHPDALPQGVPTGYQTEPTSYFCSSSFWQTAFGKQSHSSPALKRPASQQAPLEKDTEPGSIRSGQGIKFETNADAATASGQAPKCPVSAWTPTPDFAVRLPP